MRFISAVFPRVRSSIVWLGRTPIRLVTSSATDTAGEEEFEKARQWLAKFSLDTIPKNICEVTFCRSSGPGGQNVNKVNSKATLRVSLSSLLSTIPVALHQSIRSSRYTTKSDSIIIQADDSRKQSDNADSCRLKLYNIILQAGSGSIPGKTSDARRQRVTALEKAGHGMRLREKKSHSDKKSGRRSKGSGDY